MQRKPAILALEDGKVFEGWSFGRAGETTGEVVFNTALCGYQEVLTDPSYAGQIVTMTYPHIGNYGVNREDVESSRPQVAGFVVREASTVASSWRASGELHLYLDEAGVVGISEIDTRELTRHLRDFGAKRGVVSTLDSDPASLIAKARSSRNMVGLDLAREVTCPAPYRFASADDLGKAPFKVVAYDFGMKRNILRKFGHRGANHPVKNLSTGQVEITSQNHGFSVDPSLFARPELVQTHVNLNDGTVEGFRHRDLPLLSVQYHPEASPGPHDSHYLFAEFVAMMRERRAAREGVGAPRR